MQRLLSTSTFALVALFLVQCASNDAPPIEDTEMAGNTGDAAVSAGGGGATGGKAGSGGSVGSGGSASTGGSTGSGGSASTGGSTGSGGSASTGGSTGSGGGASTGGSTGSGGSVVDGGIIDAGTTSGTLGIDEAQRSGVAGFPIGVFGTGFGAAQGAGTITIGGVAAPVTAWSDTLIQAKVPSVPDQTTQIVVTASGHTVAWPLQVYSIDPSFLARPARLENLIKGSTVVITGSYTDYGKGNPPCDSGKNVAPRFLSYNSCDGAMVPTVPFTVAMPLGQAITATSGSTGSATAPAIRTASSRAIAIPRSTTPWTRRQTPRAARTGRGRPSSR